VKGRIQASKPGVSRSKKNKRYTDSPSLLLKVRNPLCFLVRLQIDLGPTDDPLAVKALEDGLVEPEAQKILDEISKPGTMVAFTLMLLGS
jgi:hypothetical protein